MRRVKVFIVGGLTLLTLAPAASPATAAPTATPTTATQTVATDYLQYKVTLLLWSVNISGNAGA
jgi:hypothetical protein